MLKRFTNALLLLCVGLSACSTMPLPSRTSQLEGAEAASAEAPLSTKAEHTQDMVAAPIEVPPLKSGSQVLFDRAVQLLAEDQLETAETLLLELTIDQPELAGPWVNLGLIYLAKGAQNDAQQMFHNALQANPRNCPALNQLGVLARREGRFGEAESYYQQCLEAQPTYADASLNLGILYELYMGRLGEALAAYNDYQLVMPEPDARVSVWVSDLERRVAAIATR